MTQMTPLTMTSPRREAGLEFGSQNRTAAMASSTASVKAPKKAAKV